MTDFCNSKISSTGTRKVPAGISVRQSNPEPSIDGLPPLVSESNSGHITSFVFENSVDVILTFDKTDRVLQCCLLVLIIKCGSD